MSDISELEMCREALRGAMDGMARRDARIGGLDATLRYITALHLSTKLEHGSCSPRSERACTHCNALDDLARLLDTLAGGGISQQPNGLGLPVDAEATVGPVTITRRLTARIAELERERDEERERCCRDVCFYCRDSRYQRAEREAVWRHGEDGDCAAYKIRERHYQQQEGEGDGTPT